MLQKIRDNSQSMAAKIFVWFLILIFGAWGASTIVSSVITGNPALSVNGVDIDEFAIERSTQSRVQEMISNLGPDADLSTIDEEAFREAAINELIQRQLLLQYAEQAGMVMSSRVIDRSIAQTPDFQIDGVFNGERAQLLLQSMGFTPNSYRAALAEEGLINQTTFTYGLSGFVTREEINRLAALIKQTRDLRYILINMESKISEIDITDAEIEAYYAANEDDFMLNEEVSVQYLELDKDSIFDEVSVTEAQVRQRYEEEQTVYQSQIERRASHILLEAVSDDDVQAALAQAADLKSRIDNGESFEDLAAEFSDDTGSAEFGGDVGYTTGDTFVEGFEQALLGLDVGQVSDPVQTEFGVHLIKLTERSESEIETFEDSRERLERDLKAAEVDRIYQERADELGNLAFESFDLADPAEIMGLELKTSSMFSRNGGPGIASNQDVVNAAFSPDVLLDNLNSNLIAVSPSRSVVIHVQEHNLPRVQDLEAVRGEIQVMLQFEKVGEQARELGETLTRNIQNGMNIDSMLELQSLSWNTIEGLERTDQVLPGELVQHIFDMSAPADGSTTIEGFHLSGGEFVVVELQAVNNGSVEDFGEGELDSLETFLSQQSANADFEALITGLQNRAEIVR